MTVAIDSVSPPRGREGDVITIDGSGFSAVPSDNGVTVDGVLATIISATTTEIVAQVPALSTRDQFVALVVQLEGSPEEQAATGWWSKPTLVEMQTLIAPGQVPGPGEDVDVEQADVQEAKDYERAMTLAEWLARELLTSPGDIYARNASEITRFGAGGAGQALEAQPAADEGLAWTTPEVRATLGWAREVQAAQNTLLALVANGGATETATDVGENAAPFDGTVDTIWVLVEEEGSTDTLDQVVLTINGTPAYDSGTGLALAQDQSHRATGLALAVAAGDLLELQAKKSGTAALMRLTGGIRIGSSAIGLSDTIVITDDTTAELTVGPSLGATDTITITDSTAAETATGGEWGDPDLPWGS